MCTLDMIQFKNIRLPLCISLTPLFVSIALVYWDMPFGLGLTEDDTSDDWDRSLTDQELAHFFTFLGLSNSCKNFTLALMIPPTETERMSQAMNDNGFNNIHSIYVRKPQVNGIGTNKWIPSMEQILVGYKPNLKATQTRFPEDRNSPLDRHNVIYSPNTGKKILRQDGKMVNVCQKHPFIAYSLGKIHCRPNSRVLVIGAGSGSDVIGFSRAGLSVTCVEKSAVQFPYLSTRINNEMVEAAKGEQNECDLAEACSKKLREYVKNFMSLCDEDQEAKKQELREKKAEERRVAKAARANSKSKGKDVPSSRPAKSKIAEPKPCTLCGEIADKLKGNECALEGCPAFIGDCCKAHQVTCADDAEVTGDHQHCNAAFCTTECFEKHME